VAQRQSNLKTLKNDENMTLMFASCINLRKVTVSSSLHTDLMFSSAAIINIENARKNMWMETQTAQLAPHLRRESD
jgi:hypothetical protein